MMKYEQSTLIKKKKILKAYTIHEGTVVKPTYSITGMHKSIKIRNNILQYTRVNNVSLNTDYGKRFGYRSLAFNIIYTI